jgi:hypothetical protein
LRSRFVIRAFSRMIRWSNRRLSAALAFGRRRLRLGLP